MALHDELKPSEKRRHWRKNTVFILFGLLAGISFWVIVLWTVLKIV